MNERLTAHLRRLEAEAILIMREAVAEFRNPVLLYSIGKDSTVLLHIAVKAFYPSKPPVKLLHIDTRWKFREMIAFRDETARRLGMELLVHVNEDGVRRNICPVGSGSALHTQLMKTGEALRQAIEKGQFDAAIGGARRDEEKSRAEDDFLAQIHTHEWNPRNQRPEILSTFLTRAFSPENDRMFPCRIGLNSTCGSISARKLFRSCLSISPRSGR